VANAVDLAAQNAVERTVAFIPAAASPVAIPIPVALAPAAIVTAVTITAPVAFSVVAALLADPFSRMLAIRFGAFFVKFVRLVRFVGGRFGNAFAFRRFVHRRWNIFIFVTRPVLALSFALAILIFLAFARFVAILGFSARIVFTRRTIVTATSAASSAAATTTLRTASASATATTAAFAITRISAFTARPITARTGGTRRRSAFGRLRFRITVFGSGFRRRRGFPSF
jgi:hypothetical protein